MRLSFAVVFAAGILLSGCGNNSRPSSVGSGGSSGSGSGSGSSSGSSGSGGSSGSSGSSGGTTASSLGPFAAGVGGAGQTNSAAFLIATKVPSYLPVPTKINSNGTLTAAKLNAPAPNSYYTAMALSGAIDPSGTYFYEAVFGVVNGSLPAAPGIYGFTIDRQTGDLTQMPNFPVAPTQNFDAIAVDQLGKFVYAYGGGQIFAYTIQSGTGQLSPVAGSPFAAAPSGQQQYFAPADRLAVSQDNKYLYVASSNGILAFSIDGTTGGLTPLPGSPFGGTNGAAFALAAPSTGFLYETVVSTGPQATTGILGYSIDKNTGALSALSGSPFPPGCAADNLTSPTNGKFLFGGRCGMYLVDPSTGALTQLFKDPGGGSWAVFDPAGAFLWMITSQQNCWHCDEGVTSFQVDSSGNMTQVPNSFFNISNSFYGGVQAIAITH